MIATLHLVASLRSAVIVALVAGLRDDPGVADGYAAWSVDSSHFVIETKRIDRVVAIGPRALAPLVREMKRQGISLDTFARCYTACDQILRKAGLKEPVHWHGGRIQTDRRSHRIVGIPLIGGFNAAFRQRQIEEIVHRTKDIGIVLDELPDRERPPCS